jgi:hypothetical protein
MREGADVVAALRWAILAGLGWAVMGAGLLRGVRPGGGTRTKKVYPEGEAPESG